MDATWTTNRAPTRHESDRRALGAGTFRPLADHVLERVSDAELVAYIAAARGAGDDRAARRAIAILTWGWQPYVELRVAGKVPALYVEDVMSAVLETAGEHALVGRATFAGDSVAEFRGWLDRIIARRIADHYRSPDHLRGTRLTLVEEADEDCSGVQLTTRDTTDAVADRLLVSGELAKLQDDHRIAAEMTEVQGHSAAEVVRRLGRRNPNWVYKNSERFRERLAAAASHQSS